MTNSMNVTLYSPGHRDTCTDLFLRVYAAPPFDFEWLDFAKASSYLMDLENTPGSLSYVLTDDNVIIGVCLGQKEEHFQNPGYKINEFFIEPEHQHIGLGTYFINELENKLYDLGLRVMHLFTQRQMNSFSFYCKNNFIPNDETVHMARAIRKPPSVIYARTFLDSV